MTLETIQKKYSKEYLMTENATMQSIEVKSTWGAIAAFLLLQILGFVLFYSLVAFIFVPMLNAWFLVWVIAFTFFQKETIKKINDYFFQREHLIQDFSIKSGKTIIKILLSVFFVITFIYAYFYLVFESNFTLAQIATIITLQLIGLLVSKLLKHGGKSKVTTEAGGRIIGVLVAIVFMVSSVFTINSGITLGYLLFSVGLGVFSLITSAWLMEKD